MERTVTRFKDGQESVELLLNRCYSELAKYGFSQLIPGKQTFTVIASRFPTVHKRVTTVFDKFTLN